MHSIQTQQPRALTTGAFLALVWVIGAALQPTSTDHVAPLLAAGIVPAVARSANRTDLLRATAAGFGLSLATAIILATIDLLRGPTLLPYGGALAEAVTFAAVGALGGALIASFAVYNRRESAA